MLCCKEALHTVVRDALGAQHPHTPSSPAFRKDRATSVLLQRTQTRCVYIEIYKKPRSLDLGPGCSWAPGGPFKTSWCLGPTWRLCSTGRGSSLGTGAFNICPGEFQGGQVENHHLKSKGLKMGSHVFRISNPGRQSVLPLGLGGKVSRALETMPHRPSLSQGSS